MGRKQRGMDFEEEVADFLEGELGYTHTTLRELVRGKTAVRPWECDIHAVKYAPVFDFLKKAGFVLTALAVLSFFFNLPVLESLMQQIVSVFNPNWAGSALLILGIVGLYAGLIGRKKGTLHAWVECKNLKTRVKRDHVIKLKEAINDVEQNEGSDWRPEKVYLFSGSGFDQDALGFADDDNIICYEKERKNFVLAA